MDARREFPFALVDAFSSQALGGNPCAVVLRADGLSDPEMLAIAKEMNQSETAFLLKPKSGHLRARYFTPEREIPLAGHPTIAAIHAARECGILSPELSQILLELNDGPVSVRVECEGNRTRIRMFQRKPSFHEIHDPRKALPIFGLEPEDLIARAPIQTVSTGTRQLMVPLRSHEALRKLAMDVTAYKAYREEMDFFSPHFFALGGATSEGDTFARHLGVPPDTMEDAFTGSATGGMAAYLFKYGLLKERRFVAEQGHWMGRPGKAWIEVVGSADEIASVSVAGEAVTTVRGSLSC